MRRIAALLASVALLLTLAPPAALAAPSETETWIVTLRDDVDPSSTAPGLARAHGGRVGFVYEHALNGFSFHGSQAAASALLRNPKVLAVEADAEVWLDATQKDATWGLDRIDQRGLPLSTTYDYTATGAGVTAYVIDSGIRYGHNDFGGRAVLGTDIVGGIDPAGSDCNGHGTHVAGTIGGATYGVAKSVKLVSVRVFGCDGGSTWEVIIAGIDWVIADHDPGEPAVANMSLGGSSNSSVDTATDNLINDGVATAVAAGNGNFIGRQADACNYSPARVPNAMTISATNSSDQKASWANYGDCVDWFAPGVSITSAWIDSDSDTNTISGTSMATPHTAGVAALYLEANPTASPATVRNAIYDATTKGVVTSSSTVNNHLLYSLIGSGGGGDTTPPAAPTSLSASAGDASVALDWSDNGESDLAGYNVYRSTTSGSGYTLLNTSGLVGASAFTDTTAVNGTTYYYVVTAEDLSGNESAKSNEASATPTAGDGIALEVSAYKVRGIKHADLTWSDTSSAHVDIYRNGAVVATVDDTGAYSETLGKGGGTYTYKVCEAGTAACSNEVTVSY